MKEQTHSPIRRYSGTIFLMILSVLCAVVSGLLLFVPSVSPLLLCRIMSMGIVAWGAAQMTRFFLMRAYRQLHDYTFSSGALLMILGGVAIVRNVDVAAHFEVVMQLAALCLGVVMVQNTVQLSSVRSRFATVEAVFALVILSLSVLTLTQPPFITSFIGDITRWTLFAAGILSTVSFPVVALAIYRLNKAAEAQDELSHLKKGEHPHTAHLPFASFTNTDELDVDAIRQKAEEQSKENTPK